jgi:hypothetical protein
VRLFRRICTLCHQRQLVLITSFLLFFNLGTRVLNLKPPRSTNFFGSSPTGVQPSSAIRALAKLKTIEKAVEKVAQREASSLMRKAA